MFASFCSMWGLLLAARRSAVSGLVFSARNKVENPPHRAGPKRGLYLSYRPLDRTKSISATRSSFFVKTKKSQNPSHFWARKPPGTSPDPPRTLPEPL